MLLRIVLVFVTPAVGSPSVRNSTIGKLPAIKEFCWLVVFVRCSRARRSALLMLVLPPAFTRFSTNTFPSSIFSLVANDAELLHSSVPPLNRTILKESLARSWLRMVNIAWRVCSIFCPLIEPLMSMTKTTFFASGLRPLGEKYCTKWEPSTWIMPASFPWATSYLSMIWRETIRIFLDRSFSQWCFHCSNLHVIYTYRGKQASKSVRRDWARKKG